MQRLRNALADVLVGIVVVIASFWLLRGIFRMVYWGASLVVLLLVVIVILRIAWKLKN